MDVIDGAYAMFQSHRNDDREVQATNLMLIGLLCLFSFVVLFVFIGMNTEMAARSDSTMAAQYSGGTRETTGSHSD